ncbi:ABC transporter substrate-binding protein [Desulfobacula sp.]|uniref:ABC transporter substrate-binding protein n=1 Tax=Desulfobacula sp. TaxID=2593537 RepID=UPI001EBBBDB8|nr:ABC transporter substrate-binding protein [Desulfobacula sp.]
MKKLIVIYVLLLCSTGLLYAGDTLEGKFIGYSQPVIGDNWREANHGSFLEAQKKYGVDVKFAIAEGKQENQIKHLKSFIAQGVDAIVFSAWVKSGYGPVLKEIKRAGIPVFLFDRAPDVDNSLYVTLVAGSFIEDGQADAEWLVENLGTKWNYVSVQGDKASQPSYEREKGFTDVVKNYPGIKRINTQEGMWNPQQSKEVMEAMLKANGKDIDVVFVHSDTMIHGVVSAIEEYGLKPGKDIIIASIDGTRDGLELVAAGKVNVDHEFSPLMGDPLYKAMEDYFLGKSVPKKILLENDTFDQEKAIRDLPTRKF